jgi:TolB-like protein
MHAKPCPGRAIAPFKSTIAALRPQPSDPDDIPAAEVRSALARVLGGAEFQKARRASRLLAFLVEKRLENAMRDTNEFTIGIEVFERDPATFDPGADPVVRVQVGRLRAKLRNYYAGPGALPAIAFSIPPGSYMPAILRRHDNGAQPGQHGDAGTLRLALRTLIGIPSGPACSAFADGLREELVYRLFQEFGTRLVAPMGSAEASAPAPTHVIEGSVRAEGERIRVGLRVIETATGVLAWSQQIDRTAPLSIGLQEELGHAVCRALTGHFLVD